MPKFNMPKFDKSKKWKKNKLEVPKKYTSNEILNNPEFKDIISTVNENYQIEQKSSKFPNIIIPN